MITIPHDWQEIPRSQQFRLFERWHDTKRPFRVFFSATGKDQITLDPKTLKIFMIWSDDDQKAWVDPNEML